MSSTNSKPAFVAASTAATSILPLIVSENPTTASPNVLRFSPIVEKSTDPPNFSVMEEISSDFVRTRIISVMLEAASIAVASTPFIMFINTIAPEPNNTSFAPRSSKDTPPPIS